MWTGGWSKHTLGFCWRYFFGKTLSKKPWGPPVHSIHSITLYPFTARGTADTHSYCEFSGFHPPPTHTAINLFTPPQKHMHTFIKSHHRWQPGIKTMFRLGISTRLGWSDHSRSAETDGCSYVVVSCASNAHVFIDHLWSHFVSSMVAKSAKSNMMSLQQQIQQHPQFQN